MAELSPTATALVEYCRANGRFCPQPQSWHRLWEMLPDRKRKPTGGWNPPIPLILSAWHETTGLDKMMRLSEHIQWADEHNSIIEIDAYLRELPESQWFHGRD